MRSTLAMCGLLVAACLAGCSSPPKLKVPSGDWEDFNPPVTTTVKFQKSMNGGGNGQHK